MFCGKCGQEIPDGVRFCPRCGNAIANAGQGTDAVGPGYPGNYSSQSVPVTKKTNRIIGIAVVAVAAILVVALVLVLFGGRNYKKAAEEYVEAMYEADSEKMMELMPKDLREALLEEIIASEWLRGEDEAYRYMNRELADAADTLDSTLGSGWKVSCEAVDVEEWTEEELEEYVDDILYDYGVDIKAKEGKNVIVQVIVRSKDGETTSEQEVPVPVVKIGRSWYVSAE